MPGNKEQGLTHAGNRQGRSQGTRACPQSQGHKLSHGGKVNVGMFVRVPAQVTEHTLADLTSRYFISTIRKLELAGGGEGWSLDWVSSSSLLGTVISVTVRKLLSQVLGPRAGSGSPESCL